MLRLTSATNVRIKQLVRLQQRGAERRKAGLFCVETPRALERAQAAGLTVQTVYATAEAWPTVVAPAQVERVEITPALLAKVAYRKHPEGFVAVVQAPQRALAELPALPAPLYVVCSGLEKPGNLGAILRSADGAGVDAVLLDRAEVDLFAPQCVRASTGTVFSLPVVGAPLPELLAWLRARGVRVVAATPDAERLYTAEDLTGPTALVMGAEAEGLATDWRQVADAPVRLPMAGLADSLNVSVAAAVLMYEAARQRAAR